MNDITAKKKFIDQKLFAFNVWDFDSAKAVIDGAVKRGKAVFLQVSSSVFDSIDPYEFIKHTKRYIKCCKADVLIQLDHSRDPKQIQKAIVYGWDAVMFDGSHLPLAENIRITNEVCNIAKKENILVEAEIGQVVGVEDGLNIRDSVSVQIEDIKRFVKSTNIDLLGVAIGTAHGHYGDLRPVINYQLIKQINVFTNLSLVVHGGSGLEKQELVKLFLNKNVKKVNISSDIKQAYRKGIFKSIDLGLLAENKVDALKVKDVVYNNIKQLVIEKLEVLGDI